MMHTLHGPKNETWHDGTGRDAGLAGDGAAAVRLVDPGPASVVMESRGGSTVACDGGGVLVLV